MKKALALILTLCLIAGMLSFTAMAEETPAPEGTTAPTEPETPTGPEVKFLNGLGSDGKSSQFFSLYLNPGEVVYVVADESKVVTQWTDTANAPTDKFIKLEYDANTATVKATFNNFVTDGSFCKKGYTSHVVQFMKGTVDYNVVVELIGENAITNSNSSCLKHTNNGTMTITGSGSLTMNLTGPTSGALWSSGTGLIIKDTTMNINVEYGTSNKHHNILVSQGNATFENATISAVNNSGSSVVFLGVATAADSAKTLDTATDRFITVKGCTITATLKAAVFESTNPAIISNSTLKATKTSSSKGYDPLFVPTPTFEGEHTALAGLAKNADKPEKLKPYKAAQLTNYTFFSLVPYIIETTAPTTEATEPETEPTIEATVPETEPTIEATQPETQAPATEATQPETQAPTTEATQPADADGETSGNPLKVVVIIIVVLVVLAGAAVAALFILKKKGIIK